MSEKEQKQKTETLYLDSGKTPSEISQMLGVKKEKVNEWVEEFGDRNEEERNDDTNIINETEKAEKDKKGENSTSVPFYQRHPLNSEYETHWTYYIAGGAISFLISAIILLTSAT